MSHLAGQFDATPEGDRDAFWLRGKVLQGVAVAAHVAQATQHEEEEGGGEGRGGPLEGFQGCCMEGLNWLRTSGFPYRIFSTFF